MGVQIGGLIGLYGGAICGILGWWLGRHFAKKERGLDELYYHIWQKARSVSWYFTLLTIYVLFSLVLFGVKISIAAVLGIVLLVHIASWGIFGLFLTIKYQCLNPLQLSKVKIYLSAAFGILLIFTFISLAVKSWLFLMVSLPIIVLFMLFAFIQKETEEEM